MFMWTRHGYLGILVILAALGGVGFLAGGLDHLTDHWWLPALFILASAAPCWVLGRLLNRGYPPGVFDLPTPLRDERTGERRPRPAGHTLWFIRLEYAGAVFAVMLVVFAVLKARHVTV